MSRWKSSRCFHRNSVSPSAEMRQRLGINVLSVQAVDSGIGAEDMQNRRLASRSAHGFDQRKEGRYIRNPGRSESGLRAPRIPQHLRLCRRAFTTFTTSSQLGMPALLAKRMSGFCVGEGGELCQPIPLAGRSDDAHCFVPAEVHEHFCWRRPAAKLVPESPLDAQHLVSSSSPVLPKACRRAAW